MGDVVLPIVVIVVLVLANGVFVAAEFALVASRPSRLQAVAAGGSRAAAWLLRVVEKPTGKDGYIAIAQLGITLASIGLGMYGEPAVAHWLYGPFEQWGLSESAAHTVGFVVALSGITYLHVVLGEMIPKALALQSPEKVSLRVNTVMRAFGFLFRPMVAVLNYLALALMRLLRIREPDKSTSLYTSAELAIVTDESAESGQLGELQRDLIRNVFELDERRAEELMTPRKRVQTIDVTATPEEISRRIVASSLSRYPVVDGSLESVHGVLHIKDFIRAQQRGGSLAPTDLMRPLPTVPASATAEGVLAEFRRQRIHAVLVVDEFGSPLGLVTMDDVIAEVMEVHDDADAEAPVRHDDGSLSVDGALTLADLRHDLGVPLDHPEVSTVGGVVLAVHSTVPSVGASVQFQGVELTVEEMDDRAVRRVRVRPVSTVVAPPEA